MEFKSGMGVELIHSMGTDETIAQAARTSTQGLNQSKATGLIRALWRDGHFSPFESSAMTVALEVPLFVRDQIVRHKSLSFSVFSLRYSEAEPVFWVPAEDRPLVQVGKKLSYEREMGTDQQAYVAGHAIETAARDEWYRYKIMLEAGVAPEVARTVLPTSLYTGMWVAGNLRSWLHFLDQRMDKHAQQEIQEVAVQVAEIIADGWPVTYAAWSDPTGTYTPGPVENRRLTLIKGGQ